MANGLAYDSDEGRALCGAITALMTGRAYRTSAEVAGAIGPYERYEENADPHMHVMRKHRHAAYELDDSLFATPSCWPRRGARGTRRSTSARATATATRRRRCSRPPGRSRS